ncbi:MAG: chromosome segregation protein SMC [Pseudomonadota bacterium]
MHFNRLRLNGFKSFVDPTDLVIAPGLTGVVGPNGCGKSNLLEALRWVMGENRPTAMRGGGMEDVIFAGAATRPARNFAEVSLAIDNSERLAPTGFNESDALDIVRRITRDAGSAYKVNTKDVRARDVQMLFADASTGAHSPALVRQGQISELINARPKARRRILEEAAGISGLYQRRHEAELKLNAAETNLARVDDVIDQLAGQLSALARQAKQAARYRDIGSALRRAEAALLYRRWSEARDLLHDVGAELQARITAASVAERGVREAEAERAERDGALPPAREEEAIAAAVLARVTQEIGALGEEEARAAKTISSLESQVETLGQDIAREQDLNRDAESTIARLQDEAAELAHKAEGHDGRLATAQAKVTDAVAALKAAEEDQARRTEEAARLAAQHQSAQRMVNDAQAALKVERSAAETAERTSTEAEAALATVRERAAAAKAQQSEAAQAAEAAEAAAIAAEETRSARTADAAQAQAARSAADGEASALRAEVTALARLVDREQSGDAPLIDQLTVAPGYELALGAALADDLNSPVIDGEAATGWATVSPFAELAALPGGAEPLADKVEAPALLARRLSSIAVVSRDEGAALQDQLAPGQRLVSREGDLWRWDGFRVAAEDASSAAGLRLQQLNRLTALRADLADVEARQTELIAAHDAAKAALGQATEADKAARAARKQADTASAESGRALNRAETELSRTTAQLEAAQIAVSRHRDAATEAAKRLADAEASLAELPDLTDERAALETAKRAVDLARTEMLTNRSAADELRRVGEDRQKRAQDIANEEADWRARLNNAEMRASELARRLEDAEQALATARSAPSSLAERREKLSEAQEAAETRRKAAADALATAETIYREAEAAERQAAKFAGEAREARAAAEAREEAARESLQAAQTRVEEEMECAPEDILEQFELDPDQIASADALDADISKLRRQRDALGAVNLRAEEDAKAVQEEHDLLIREKADLEAAIRTLRAGISGLNKEGRERLLTAFEQVDANFSTLFRHLFNGGEARLELVESDDPLDAGLEIMCQPPGKKLSTLSLLSGGEQTLTALALIFAVFLANPAPICVLDEVDAPLDDANVTRFCDLLDEMTRRTETRFLIITHHAVTMARMDRLFGVTMQEQGVSQLVSVDLKRAEALVA